MHLIERVWAWKVGQSTKGAMINEIQWKSLLWRAVFKVTTSTIQACLASGNGRAKRLYDSDTFDHQKLDFHFLFIFFY